MVATARCVHPGVDAGCRGRVSSLRSPGEKGHQAAMRLQRVQIAQGHLTWTCAPGGNGWGHHSMQKATPEPSNRSGNIPLPMKGLGPRDSDLVADKT